MSYVENPKTKGSGMLCCCIFQSGVCPAQCKDCLLQSDSFLPESLSGYFSNVPTVEMAEGRVVCASGGYDGASQPGLAAGGVRGFEMKFYNISVPDGLEELDAPVILTVNPAAMTDTEAYLLETIPDNLMFVRIRTNTWNLPLVKKIVKHYSEREIPIVLTFAVYLETEIPEKHGHYYVLRKKAPRSYCVIGMTAWERIVGRFVYNKWVYSCGGIDGVGKVIFCRHCGNCLREYFATMERLRRKWCKK